MPYPSPFPELIDSTTLVTWRACARKGAYAHFDNLTLSPSVDLHFGGALAAGLERARKDYFVGNIPARIAENNGLNAASDFWGDFAGPDNHAKNWGSLLQALSGYFKMWPIDCDPVVPLVHGSIEFTFAIPTGVVRPDRNEPILYAGRFDLLGSLDGMPVIVDEKTTGRGFSSSWSEGWNLRNQFLLYIWACRQSGWPHMNQVFIRGVSVQKTKMDFTQAIATIPEFLLDRAHTQLLRDLERMKAQWLEGYFDYNFGDTCTAYGKCPFMELCTAQNPTEWYSMYQRRTWSPLAKDPTEGAP